MLFFFFAVSHEMVLGAENYRIESRFAHYHSYNAIGKTLQMI